MVAEMVKIGIFTTKSQTVAGGCSRPLIFHNVFVFSGFHRHSTWIVRKWFVSTAKYMLV